MIFYCLPVAISYEETTKIHYPLITERNDTGMVGGSVEIVDGPFGFDRAIKKINDSQVNLSSRNF